MTNIVVLFKTHKWSDDIEKFVKKIYSQTYPNAIDFYILMHDEKGDLYGSIICDQIKNIVHRFTENDIKSIYPAGFFGMWLSNHWILMWFYKKYGQKYKYFWSIEYDVRISGDTSKIWLYGSSYDFLYPMGNYRNAKNIHNKHYVGDKLKELDKYHGFLQLARYSDNAMKYLNQCFESGENGQDELIIFSLLNRSGLTGSRAFLRNLVRGTWTWQDKFSEPNKKMYYLIESNPVDTPVYIFHPIK